MNFPPLRALLHAPSHPTHSSASLGTRSVYSFAVVMYELLGRTLLAFSHLGTKRPEMPGAAIMTDGREFAQLVARGYRPPRPRALLERAWPLVQACWAHDPLERPAMRRVVGELEVSQPELCWLPYSDDGIMGYG